jgi:hypothetical protein
MAKPATKIDAPQAPPGIVIHSTGERRAVAVLVPYARNSRTHSAAQVAQLCRSFSEYGFTNPVLIDEGDGIIAGHGRVMAAHKAGMAEVPVVVCRGLTEAQKRALVIADNRLAENAAWDDAVLLDELRALHDGGHDISLTGFNTDDVLKALAEQDEASVIDLGPESLEGESDELPGAAALKSDMRFDGDDRYWDIPNLRADMLGSIPDPIRTWAGPDVSVDDGATSWFYQWGSDSTRGLDFARTMLGFYVDDVRFERFLHEPAKYVTKLLNAGIKAAVQPNFSMPSGWPLILNHMQLYKARWIARYMQEAGIMLIPDMNFLDIESVRDGWVFAGLPREVPALSIQIQATSRWRQPEIDDWKACMDLFLARCKPKQLLVYGGPLAKKIAEEVVPPDVTLIFVPNRSEVRRPVADAKSKSIDRKKGQHHGEGIRT